ncbi:MULTISPECIES: O-antigen ligase family protein [unclassified Chelatococcus]|uniref:O-antigen ligase family protein n=1 Tax=unclassified Chelatococcus TaxID=2638111 RepID=UPI001BD0472B|nr:MULTISPECIES: O-antigen ligase family protein [unclassified Chelatococcus]CAH1671808.1 O-antigen ligase [Hyphomicrobiales bacterium]MBS7739035.1 O-antigen ligase family protein [Chelatococcus sp. HY11]MBX3543470.1 O-antigen ligase family protein [Chelatococcus sp.]MCO5076435.1 O-antigen ligase family protein [Chelatococcus sp.]CAH1675986.1 O-antigen ligase [Hyphomicrobiales bacterium]
MAQAHPIAKARGTNQDTLERGAAARRKAPRHRLRLRISLARLDSLALWLFVFAGAFVLIEPSLYELLFPLALVVALLIGFRVPASAAPMIVLLTLFNMGGAFALIPYLDESRSVMFIVISLYLAMTSVFFASILTHEPERRLETIRSALIWSAWPAGIASLLGYFDVAGLGSIFTVYGRASGTFKDPNVMGPYMVLPIVYIVQGFIERRSGVLKTIALLSVPLLALFLSFSRGAWADLVGALALLFALSFVTGATLAQRRMMIVYALGCIAVLVVMLGIALSIDDVREIFTMRASLSQDYDEGTTGRFGNQLRSIPLLLEHVNGLGPLRFHVYFNADPHSVYINAFASYGWLGGLSYLTLIIATWIVAWRTVFRRSPLQSHAIAVWSALIVITIQGFQIDTDHWRQFYLMLGLTWGIAAASKTLATASVPTIDNALRLLGPQPQQVLTYQTRALGHTPRQSDRIG